MTGTTIQIVYRRPPDRIQHFRQALVSRTADYAVTLLESAELKEPVLAGSRVILEPGAPVVWFTYQNRWYDVGRFHLADGTFTGFYANILTPITIAPDRWETTDLFLDVWKDQRGGVEILDEEELEAAFRAGWLDEKTTRTARNQASSLADAARQGIWPDQEVLHWTLERATAAVAVAKS